MFEYTSCASPHKVACGTGLVRDVEDIDVRKAALVGGSFVVKRLFSSFRWTAAAHSLLSHMCSPYSFAHASLGGLQEGRLFCAAPADKHDVERGFAEPPLPGAVGPLSVCLFPLVRE